MCCKQFITPIILVSAESLWHLGSMIYHDTQYSQRGCFTNLLWCHIPWNKAPQTGPHHIWCIYTLLFFGRDKRTDSSAFGLMILLASVCYGPWVAKHFLRPHLVLQPVWGWGVLGTFQLPQSILTRRSLKSLSVYLAPREDNSIQLLSSVRCRWWKNSFMVHLLLDQQKDEHLCSFLEAVPRLVISQLLQLVVWLCWGLELLLLLLLLFFFFSSSSFPTSPLLLLPPQNSESVSATTVSLMASPSSSVFPQPLLQTYSSVPCLDCNVWQGTVEET